MNKVERRLCDFTSGSVVQCLSCYAKYIGLLNRCMDHTVLNRWSSTSSYQGQEELCVGEYAMIIAMILMTLIKHTTTQREADRTYQKRKRTWRHSGLLERSSLSLTVLLYQLQFCHQRGEEPVSHRQLNSGKGGSVSGRAGATITAHWCSVAP